VWASNSDQILTLSLFHSGDICRDDCIFRFANRGYVGCLYDRNGNLNEDIASRYQVLIDLLRAHASLMKGGGDMQTPADPTFTACRLTDAGCRRALSVIDLFPQKPEFPEWPDRTNSRI
jgi:hypothetical protein